MDTNSIHEKLEKLRPCPRSFTVILTGRSNAKVNGLYKPATAEILLFNKNFNDDNELMYTAVHEYTHHLLSDPENIENSVHRPHTEQFWELDHNLLDEAEKKGIYSRKRSAELSAAVEKAKETDRKIAELQKQLGTELAEIRKIAETENVRYEDIIDHDLEMTRQNAKKTEKIAALPEKLTAGKSSAAVELMMTARKIESVERISAASGTGKTPAQIRAEIKPKTQYSEREKLSKEKERIQKTITLLTNRLETINTMLKKEEKQT